MNINVLVIEEGCEGIELVAIDKNNQLEELQKIVGGLIEPVTTENEFDIICNEEGKIKGLKPTMPLKDYEGNLFDILVGNIVITKADGEEWVGLEQSDIEHILTTIDKFKGIPLSL